MAIYETINNEIFTDSFYNIYFDNNKKLLAWYFLNIKNFSEKKCANSIFLSDIQSYIDGMYFDEEFGIVHMLKVQYTKEDVFSESDVIDNSLRFLQLLFQSFEIDFKQDSKLNRAYYYLLDCMDRNYKIVFEFITTAEISDEINVKINGFKETFLKEKNKDVEINTIDGKLLENYFKNGEPVIEKDDISVVNKPKVQKFNFFNIIEESELPAEDVKAIEEFAKVCRQRWTEENLSGFDDSFIALGEFALYLHIYAILECFSIVSEINDNRLPSPHYALKRLKNGIFVDNVVTMSAKCINNAFNLYAKENKKEKIKVGAWLRSGKSFEDVRKSIDSYFKYLAFMTRGTRELLASYNEIFLIPKHHFTLHLKVNIEYEQLFGTF